MNDKDNGTKRMMATKMAVLLSKMRVAVHKGCQAGNTQDFVNISHMFLGKEYIPKMVLLAPFCRHLAMVMSSEPLSITMAIPC